MESNVTHVYVPHPVEAARKAWNEFLLQNGSVQTPPDNVHFIPAQGGCFVVAVETRAGLLSWAPIHRTTTINSRHLQRFCRSLKESKAPKPWKEWLTAG